MLSGDYVKRRVYPPGEYTQFAGGYLRGKERRDGSGNSGKRTSSASFFMAYV